MFGEKDSQFRNSASMNNATFNDYMYRFMKIATSIFEWENLPESCSAEYLEYCLYAYGSAAFLYDNNFGFINTKAVPNGELNIYGLPTKINCYSFNYQEIRDLYSGLSSDNEEKEEGKFVRRERYVGSCSRSFYVGNEVKSEDIKASFKNGILKIEVPKKEYKKELPEKKYIQIED